MSDFLEKVLNGDELPKAETSAEPVVEPEKTLARDEQGRFAKGDIAETPTAKEPETKKPEEDPEARGLKAAIAAERKKRQELERQLHEAQRQHIPPPNLTENPEGFQQHLQQSLQASLINERLNLSETMVREKHGDELVDESVELFEQAVKTDPTLASKLFTERNPYGWLVKWSKTQKLMQQVGDDPDKFISQKEAELRAKLEQEYAQKYRQPVSVPTPSLASASGGRIESTPQWQGPTSLDSILKKR